MRDVFSRSWSEVNGAGGPAVGPDEELDYRLLPYPEGALTFSVGAGLKMAVMKWSNWASDIGVKEESLSPSRER